MAKNSYSENRKKQQAKKRDREYKAKQKFLIEIGAYQPTAETLTRKRKSNINALYRKFGQFDSPDYIAVKIEKPKTDTKQILKRAKDLQLTTTKKVIIVPKRKFRSAKLAYNKRTKEYEIHMIGKVRRGERMGKSYRENIPLAPLKAHGDAERELRDMASSLGPLKKNERLAFKIVDGHTSHSLQVYSDIDALIRRLNEYQRSEPAKIELLRHIIIEKTTVSEWFGAKAERARQKRLRKNRRGPRKTRD